MRYNETLRVAKRHTFPKIQPGFPFRGIAASRIRHLLNTIAKESRLLWASLAGLQIPPSSHMLAMDPVSAPP